MKRNVMKEAHGLTKRIIRKGDSYKATFRMCLSFVHSQIKKAAVNMVELKGTEKQVKWATEIKNEMVKATEIIEAIEETLSNFPKIDNRFIEVLNKMKQVRESIKNEENAKWFIDKRYAVAHFSNGLKTDLVELDFNAVGDFGGVESKAVEKMTKASRKLYIEKF